MASTDLKLRQMVESLHEENRILHAKLPKRIRNLGALELSLTPEELRQINAMYPADAAGDRCTPRLG